MSNNSNSFWSSQLLTNFKNTVLEYLANYAWNEGDVISSQQEGKSLTTVKELYIQDFRDRYNVEGDFQLMSNDHEVLYNLTKISVTRTFKTEKTKVPVTEIHLFYEEDFFDEPNEVFPEQVTIESLIGVLDDFDAPVAEIR